MKTLLLLLGLSLVPYYHVPTWFDNYMTGKCVVDEKVNFCYLAAPDTSGRIMIGIGFKQYFPTEFDSLFTVWNDTAIYYLNIEDFVR